MLLNQVEVNADVGTDIRVQFQNLFPSIPLMLATLIAFIFAFIFLVYFLYKPIKRFIAQRKLYITNNIKASEEAIKQAKLTLESANDSLKHVKENSEIIISDAKIEAEKIAMRYIANAKNDATHLLNNAKMDIQKQQEEFENSARDKIVNFSLDLSKQILKREVNSEIEEDLISKFDPEIKIKDKK